MTATPGTAPASNGTGPGHVAPDSVPWAQQNAAKSERATARVRKMVQGLPGWDPLPPGEQIVRRPGSTY